MFKLRNEHKIMHYDVFERIKKFVIDEIKTNYSEVAEQLEIDPQTVKTDCQRALRRTVKKEPKKAGKVSLMDNESQKLVIFNLSKGNT